MNKLVELEGITKSYDKTTNILDGLDFSISRGESTVILGKSGCGKSTLLNIIGMLESFDKGTYLFDGNKVKIHGSFLQKSRADSIGFVFQSYCLIESLSVYDNVCMPFMYCGKPFDKTACLEADELMERLDIKRLKSKKASLLSGGEKQRTAIARAMVKKPKLIIADEPTGNLDNDNTKIVVDAFKKATASGTAVIMVTHNTSIDFEGASYYVLENGRLSKC